jgi:hypothetical protein
LIVVAKSINTRGVNFKKIPLSPQRKTRNESFGFFVFKKCQKFTFEPFFENKKPMPLKKALGFSCARDSPEWDHRR